MTEFSPIPVMQVVEMGAGMTIRPEDASRIVVGESFELYQHPVEQQPQSYLSKPAISDYNGMISFIADEVSDYGNINYKIIRGVFIVDDSEVEHTTLYAAMYAIDENPSSGTFNGIALVPK